MFVFTNYSLLQYVLAISLFIPYQLCSGTPTTLSLQVEPSEIEEIDFISSKDDNSPLVLEVADPNQNTDIERQDFNFEEQPEFEPADMEEVDQNPEETMDTANALVFRPLFAYRNKKFSRRSASQGGVRPIRRRSQQQGTVVTNNFGHKSPPYLVYDRKSGAYYPYYFPKDSYGQIRRS